MFKTFLGGWEDETVNTFAAPSQSRPKVTPTSPNDDGDDDHDDAKEDEIAKELLTQFPAYGTRSQAQNNNLNPTADWLLGGTANIPSQQQLLLKQQQQQQQQQQQEEENALTEEKQVKDSTPAERVFVNRDWDEDEKDLWRVQAVEDPPDRKTVVHKSQTDENPETHGTQRSCTTPKFDDPAKDWIFAYYYHTGITPSIQISRPHPMFDRGPSNGFRKTLPRSAFSGLHSMQELDHILPQITPEEDAEIYDDHDVVAYRSKPEENGTHAKALEDRQHWMPDRLCKFCYSCDTPFTVFRRRHHCRLCGQVFCNNCSGFFVPADQNQNPNARTILRACKMCYEQVTERRQLEEEEDIRKRRKSTVDTPALITSPAPTYPNTAAPSSSLQQELNREDSLLTSLSKKQTNGYANKSLQSQEEALETFEKEQANLILPSKSDQKKEEIQQETRGIGSPDRAFHQRMVRNETVACSAPPDKAKAVREGNRQLGLAAATHLEETCKSLLSTDAPLLFSELCKKTNEPNKLYDSCIAKLLTLATRCCSTVEPNVKKGDFLDIRPYVKVKVIPGGVFRDSSYISGVVFRRIVTHKQMAKEVINPSIMLLSGGIEFTRTENRIASLETMMEQESKYIEILVGKILKVKPDILLVGRAVSRKAQELLLGANVTLVQHVKASLLNRISRQTGATVISSTDHIMNQFGAHVLGRCNRFRIIIARNNEVWGDHDTVAENPVMKIRNISKLLNDPDLANAERQAALAANLLGENIADGHLAVKCGIAKRGVTETYVMLEGCPKHLGCTVILRGASRAALKQVKVVFRFLVNAAYNLRLETSFLRERCAQLQPSYHLKPEFLYSSSLGVDYGQPPSNRKIRPWNGGSSNEASQRSLSGQISAFDHQSILISSVWMTDKTQCCPAEVKGICYYSQQDVSLGQFLRDSCFNLSLKCQNPSCKKSVLDHVLSFVHHDGMMNITVDHMDDPLPPAPASNNSSVYRKSQTDAGEEGEVEYPPIATWTYCQTCSKVVTPLVYISESTWKYSFGKFLESFFYNHEMAMNSPQSECKCNIQTSSILYFGCGRLAARFTYERIRPYGVFVRKSLPVDLVFHRNAALKELERISMSSSLLFVKFDKHIGKVSREARSISSGMTSKRSDYLKTVISELHRISSEVDHASKTLQEKIASVSHKCSSDDSHAVVSDALLRFPWFARRYLYMLASAWNEKLSAAGSVIVAMKKISASSMQRNDGLGGPGVPAIASDQHEELHEGIRRLRQLHEVYSRYNITDIKTVLPIIPGKESEDIEDDDFDDPENAIDFADGVDADVLASRRRLYQSTPTQVEAPRLPTKSLGTKRVDSSRESSSALTSKVTPGGAVKSALTRFFNRGGREFDPYVVNLGIFGEGRPRLEPGVNGIVVPVFDDQLCTVVAYSLSSQEYATQFQAYAKLESNFSDNLAQGQKVGSTASLDANSGSAHKETPNFPSSPSPGNVGPYDKIGIERRMLVRTKSHVKHTFRENDSQGQSLCKFVCTTYWATQFQAVRQAFLSPHGSKGGETNSASYPGGIDVEQAYVQSLSSAFQWAASGGKSGASFARTSDDRFVLKCISRTELQMFLESAPAYFEYLSKAFFHGLPTVLCKIVGVYQIGYHNRVTGKRSMEQVAVMQNIFYNKKITKTFDLKGSLRGRFAAQMRGKDDGADTPSESNSAQRGQGDRARQSGQDSDTLGAKENTNSELGTLLDGDFLEFTGGRPLPMNDRAKAVFHMSILNDTLFLSIINVLDYSILVGVDEERMELVVGIIDFMRQYDILKQMERVGKSLPMVVGSEAPTIIQPPLYKARFINAMERYFMTVPSKWTTI